MEARPRKKRGSDFWTYVQVTESGCWEWQGYCSTTGYGQVRINGKVHGTHRVAYEWAYGPIPEGMFVCHKCDNRPCCNPEHLFLGTVADNNADARQKGRHRNNPPRGEANTSAKLTEAQVIAIREAYANKEANQTQLAKRYGVDLSTVWAIIRRKGWKHVS